MALWLVRMRPVFLLETDGIRKGKRKLYSGEIAVSQCFQS
jgi:hypothetical protein